ncbi:MAG TPA: hypothetical protein VEZ70_09020 [Allosphingosinicella sp.]|nr:hypothetical protein [Allosphingosinicella sp.]
MGKWMLALVVLAGLPGEAPAAGEKPRYYGAGELNIAGAALGMKPGEVAVALTKAGYSRVEQIRGISWEEKISIELAASGSKARPKAYNQGILSERYSKGQEEVEVSYLPVPAGAAVHVVTYRIRRTAMTPTAFTASVIARYGKPTVSLSQESVYCSVGEEACSPTDFPQRKQLPSLTVALGDYHALTLRLVAGAKAERDYSASVKDELARRVPQVKRPTF